MGAQYGQRSRLLLNNDAIFLGELLTELSADQAPISEWKSAYQSRNCLSLPSNVDHMPLSLQVSAAVTLVMSEFKVRDQVVDSDSRKWKLALKVYTQSFYDASQRLATWEFPISKMREWFDIQAVREAEITQDSFADPWQKQLSYVAEPTAEVTGLVFQQATKVVDSNQSQTMYHLGFAFGELVYTLDALEDFEKDVKGGEFNPLQQLFELENSAQLPPQIEALVSSRLHQIADQIEERLRELPMERDLTLQFVDRLQSNLSKRLGEIPTVTRTPFQRFAHAMMHLLPSIQLRPALAGGLPFQALGTMTTEQPNRVDVVRKRGRKGCCGPGLDRGVCMSACAEAFCMTPEACGCVCSTCCVSSCCP